ncbi:serine acetyltransferase [Sphingobacterium alkalisoli]|uniref:Serine acetyltransferase n=1 Tax=Sphingobacterium alkalisoli TaxID=1874115 RepID=A0A4U0GRE9_9SPHI|nr:serine acetyltransferase [Sphingobacterium alkalisoli]TJY60172.1 serine acetyltransferase [Sphingobacterium alkalisoli]GGH32361.1 serine O-acetyltransferase [Sphingobacterium alkalisoli]
MIKSKTDYLEYLERDRKALKVIKQNFLKQLVVDFFFPNVIYIFQRKLRKVEYYKNTQTNIFRKMIYLYFYRDYRNYQLKLGFSIPPNTCGPGLSIAHYGTIVINGNAKIGANCRVHIAVNIGATGGTKKAPFIGDNVYIGPGVKIFGDIKIANGTTIGANAVVNRSVLEENTVIVGVPAKKVK